jgi:hypothetical protein
MLPFNQSPMKRALSDSSEKFVEQHEGAMPIASAFDPVSTIGWRAKSQALAKRHGACEMRQKMVNPAGEHARPGNPSRIRFSRDVADHLGYYRVTAT